LLETELQKIKKYYIIPRAKLIELLMMDSLPESYIIEKKTIHELRKEAQAKNLPNILELEAFGTYVELLYPTKTDLMNIVADGHKKV
jgi:hypothetical protein